MAALAVAPAAAAIPEAPAAQAGASAPVARRVVEAAGAFHGYTRRAAALSDHFETGGGVAKALTVGASYEPTQLATGAAAYGMLAALQDFAFVQAVREAAPSPAAAAALTQRLQADPAAVLDIAGADEAAVRVAQLIGRRGADLAQSGEAVRKAAYAVQKESWSKAAVEHAPERLLAVKALGASPATLAASDQDELMTGLVSLRTSPAYRAQPGARPTPVVARALAAAAVTVLGGGGEEHADDMMRLLADARGVDCLKMAKLNLYQCLAVAGPHYEDMFCLGRHAMTETGQCLTSAAGWTGPLEAAPALVPAVATATGGPAPISVSVPIANAATDGLEHAEAFAPVEPEPASPPAAAHMQVARADLPRFEDVARAAAPPPPGDDLAPPASRAAGYAARNEDEGAYGPAEERARMQTPDDAYAYGWAPRRPRRWARPPQDDQVEPAYAPADYGAPAYPSAYGYAYPDGGDGR